MEVARRCDFQAGDEIGAYRVERVLGEGAFGKVFKVSDRTGGAFALKLLKLWEVHPEIRQQLVARFDMEFETGQISSHYLVHSLAHGLVGGNPYIVMEFCSNGDLLQWVKSGHADLVKTGREILYGLKDLHRCGKVHRDLKPENVLVKEDGAAVLTDFGIAGDRNKRMTERNLWGKPTQIFGTYAYMPPEQVRPEREATVLPTTDIFSFGVVMYRMLTGRLPFGPLNDENDLVRYIKNGREGQWNREALNASDVGFAGVIEGCLVPDFKQRLQTVEAVLERMPRGTHEVYRQKSDPVAGAAKPLAGTYLRVMQGEEHGKRYRLEELLRGKRVITVGRGEAITSNSLSIREEQSCYISRRHCTLEWDANTRRWYIRDGQWDGSTTGGWKNSLNGTFVNSTEVTAAGMPLEAGDIISIGEVKLRYEV